MARKRKNSTKKIGAPVLHCLNPVWMWGRRRSTSPCLWIEIRNRCAIFRPSRKTCTLWQPG